MIGAAVFVSEGKTNADTAWMLTTNAPITVGTTSLAWTQFGAGAAYVAGNGLTLTGSTFDVVGGTGITVAADLVSVDTTTIATRTYADTTRRYAGALTGTTSAEVVTHNRNTRDVIVQVLNGSTPYPAVVVDWDATTANTVTIRFNPALGAGYRVVVLGV